MKENSTNPAAILRARFARLQAGTKILGLDPSNLEDLQAAASTLQVTIPLANIRRMVKGLSPFA